MESFNKPVFLKEDSTLKQRLEYLRKNPISDGETLYKIKTGVDGEDQLAYHLNRTNIPMYILRDIHLSIDGINTQIDFVVITSHHCYFMECKNYNAKKIKVDSKGDFLIIPEKSRRYIGIQSPLSQVNEQMELFKRICINEKREFNDDRFKEYFKSMVIFANNGVILNTNDAPAYIKYNVKKLDNFINQLKYDEKHYKGKELNQEQMLNLANFILSKNVKVKIEEPIIEDIKDKTQPIDYTIVKNIVKSNNRDDNNVLSRIVIILFLIFLSIGLVVFGLLNLISKIDLNNKPTSQQSTINANILSDTQLQSLEKYKNAIEESKSKGFALVETSDCLNISKIFNNGKECSSCCDRIPYEVTFENNRLTMYHQNGNYCSTAVLSSDGTIVESAKTEVGKCNGYPVGNYEYNPYNNYCKLIGGQEKIEEMATYSYINNTFVSNYMDFTHVEERGGSKNNWGNYKMNVDMYFSALTNRGYDLKALNTKMEQTGIMCQNYYYIMK